MKKRKIINIFFQEIAFFIILAIFIFLSSKAIFHQGFFRTVDDLTTVRIDYLYRELKENNWLNNFPVRISGQLSNNYGYPLYLFYSPLTYYIGALLMFFGKSHIVATKFVYVFPLIFGPIFFYFAAREKLEKRPALLASLIFTLYSYRGYNIYFRGDAPESWAIAFIPLVFLGLFLMEKRKFFGGFILSLGLFLTIFSHHLAGALVFGFVLFYGLIFLRNDKFFWQYLILSFGLVIFYLLPMFYYLKMIKLTYLKKNTYEIINNLLPIKSLINLNFKVTQQTKFLSVDIYIFIFGLILLLLFKSSINNFFWGLTGLFFYLLLFTPSVLFWQITLPITGILQFPWRLLILISFIFPFFLGVVLNGLKNNFIKLFFSFILIIYALIFLPIFKPLEYSYFYEYKPEGPCATVSHENEFLPLWVKKCPPPKEFLSVSKNSEIKIISQKPLFIDAKINLNKDDFLIINKYYFPGWRVFIDEKEAKIDYNFSPYGIFRVFIKKGEHRIRVFYTKTLIMWISDLISLFSFFILVYLFFKNLKFYKKEND